MGLFVVPASLTIDATNHRRVISIPDPFVLSSNSNVTAPVHRLPLQRTPSSAHYVLENYRKNFPPTDYLVGETYQRI
jgi:hypothetical protein